ncbi:Catechol 2,3-dioxygenase [Mesobacillus persicus]|uniref:Catechol 2,3-dioxygenase n=1 Tax=Mesobacillus persicus TaxID=930146 RepID=A0A1H7WAF4_9BACI|nr:VOC family protein [Mesobacillus persicus]SEM18460.1 Catechol 2,3-dioxygenase [Mesobacillus persicus]
MEIHHYSLEVRNLKASIAFYQTHLGFQIEQTLEFMGEEIVFLTLGECRLELISNQAKAYDGNSRGGHLCFVAADLTKVMKDIPILEGPYQLENGWRTLFCEGPDHEVIEFLQINPGK